MRANKLPGSELPAWTGLSLWVPRFTCHEMSVVEVVGWAVAALWRQPKRGVADGNRGLSQSLELAQGYVLRLCPAG